MNLQKDQLLKITPVGGVGQIGSNMALVSTPNQHIIIDAGILFPYEDFFDINYLIPDLEALKKKITPTDIVITHGHEDHIGAMVHLSRTFPDIKIWAPPFAAALIRSKFDYANVSHKVQVYQESSILDFKEMTIHPIQVNHSIPDTFGLLIQDLEKKLSLFYISDFKYDDQSPYEPPMNLEKLVKLSKNSKRRIMLSDSTNITSSVKKTPSESQLIAPLQNIVESTTTRIIVTCFSSNVHRVQTIINIAADTGRKVVLYGRSMIKYAAIAKELDILKDPKNVLVEAKSVTDQKENLIIIASGCQGDFRGTLRRIATGTDSIFKIRASDTVIFSSKNIPGSEKKVFLIINKLCEQGCHVITDRDDLIHASGHPGTDDLKKIYDTYNPTDIVPIHGETLFLHRHMDFIQSSFPDITAHLMTNYDSMVIKKDLEIITTQEAANDPILIHGAFHPIEKEAISERRKLACNGSVFISIEWNSLKTRKPSYQVEFMGLPHMLNQHKESFDELLMNTFLSTKSNNPEKEAEQIRITCRRFFGQLLGYRPIAIVHMV